MLCRNAERSNTFKLDLHALHVDEALDEVAKTISDLSKMKCKFMCCDFAFCDRQIRHRQQDGSLLCNLLCLSNSLLNDVAVICHICRGEHLV